MRVASPWSGPEESGPDRSTHIHHSPPLKEKDKEAAPVLRDVMRTQIKGLLMEAIVDGRYPPGSRLIETRIARELGVSQAPVREALRDLESVGVVESFAFRGARVRKPSPAELVEAFPVRAALESLAAREAAQRISKEQLVELDRLVEEMIDAARRRDAHSQSAANAQFHALVVRAAGNATLERQWMTLEPFARTYLTASHPGMDLVYLAQRHRKVVQQLRRHDSDGAAAAMHDHLMEASSLLREGGNGPNG